jgi:hypothetical protein
VVRTGEEIVVHMVLVEKFEGKSHWGYPALDGRILLKWISRMVEGWWDLMELTQERDRWRALVSTVMNLRVQKSAGKFLIGCKDWLASQGLCCVE